MPLIAAANLRKTYRLGRVDVPVLRGVEISVEPGEFVAILGASGSGKSTLLHLLGALDRPDRGDPAPSIRYRDEELVGRSASTLDQYRTTQVGFVFQFYHLLPELTTLENVLLGAMIAQGRLRFTAGRSEHVRHATNLLERVGLGHRLCHRPTELSGGERQRAALARALMNAPPLVLADEPTGNLDRVTGAKILDLFSEMHRQGQTIVVVTHDEATAERAQRVLRLVDGQMVLA